MMPEKIFYQVKGGYIKDAEIEMDWVGLTLYLVESESDIYITLEGEKIYNQKKTLYYFDKDIFQYERIIFNSLKYEYALYQKNHYACDGFKEMYEITNSKGVTEKIVILKTPINFYDYL